MEHRGWISLRCPRAHNCVWLARLAIAPDQQSQKRSLLKRVTLHLMIGAVEDAVGTASRAINVVAVAAEGSLEVAAIAHVQRQHPTQYAMFPVLARVIQRTLRLHHFQRLEIALDQFRITTLERDQAVDHQVALVQVVPRQRSMLALRRYVKRKRNAVD